MRLAAAEVTFAGILPDFWPGRSGLPYMAGAAAGAPAGAPARDRGVPEGLRETSNGCGSMRAGSRFFSPSSYDEKANTQKSRIQSHSKGFRCGGMM